MTQTFTSRFNNLLLFFISATVLMAAFAAVIMSYKLIGWISRAGSINFVLIMLFFVLVGVLLIGYFLIRFYVKASPKIIISKQEIRIGNKVILFNKIAKIEIFSPTKRRTLQRNEVTSILLEDGSRHELYIEHYANGNLIRKNLSNLNRYLQKQTIDFDIVESNQKYTTPDYTSDNFSIYERSPFTSFVFWIWTVSIAGNISLYIFLSPSHIEGLIALVIICAMFYGFAAWPTNYFLLSDNYLVVKSLLLPWKQTAIPLQEIKTITTQDMPQVHTALKVITKDYRLYRFQSSLLNNSMFDNLIEDINRKQRALNKIA